MNQLSADAHLAARLQELRGELARGEAQLAELDQRRAALRDTLLRISGAVQVLQELVEPQPAPASLFPVQPAPEMARLPAEDAASLPGAPEMPHAGAGKPHADAGKPRASAG